MKNTLKGKAKKIYLINAYSNYDPEVFFISGSDKVALEFASLDLNKSSVIGPASLVSVLPDNIEFYCSQKNYTGILIIDYIVRTFNSFKILSTLGSDNIIISSSDFFCDVIPAYLNKKTNKWFTFTYHLYPSFLINFKLRDLYGKILQDFSYLLSNSANRNFTSNFECVNYLSNKFNNNKVIKIPLGINLSKYEASDNKDIDVLFLGRIKETKGIFDLPEIVSLIKLKISNLSVVVIGNGPANDRGRLKELDSNFKSNLALLGSVSDEVVRDNLSRSKILIQLDSENGFGLNIVEALASGCIVIGYDLPSYRDNFYDLELKMCPQGQKLAVAEKIIETLNEYKSQPILINKLSRFDWNSIYKTIFTN